MASGLTLRVGTANAKVDFKGTDAQFRLALADLIIAKGLTTTGTDQEKLQRIIDAIWLENMEQVRHYRRDKLVDQQRTALQEQLDSELPI